MRHPTEQEGCGGQGGWLPKQKGEGLERTLERTQKGKQGGLQVQKECPCKAGRSTILDLRQKQATQAEQEPSSTHSVGRKEELDSGLIMGEGHVTSSGGGHRNPEGAVSLSLPSLALGQENLSGRTALLTMTVGCEL